MVTLTKYSALSGGEVYNRNVLWIEQLSSETKPTGTFIEYDSNGKEVARMYIPNGSVLSEINTGKTYKYDEENALWYEFAVCGRDAYTKAETDVLLAGKADLDSDGLVPTSQIPPEVFERMTVVQDDTARFALTTDDVQNGDVVYVNDDEVMYYVYDDTKLNIEAGYKPFAAGTAAKAIADKNGNDITTTYALNTAVDAIKFDSSYDIDIKCNITSQQFLTWSTKTWNGLTNFRGLDIWTDGDNIYYSLLSDHYVLDKATSTWSVKTWNGLTEISTGGDIWTDGNNIYYSSLSNQYVLDKATSTWSAKTWNGLTNFNGRSVWTDGNYIYYSSDNKQYVLNKSTSTWSAKTWTGLTNFNGEYIWSDGENIYYSYFQDQYVLNKSNSTWSVKTWYGLTNPSASSLWSDGRYIYYPSVGRGSFVLDKTTSTWVNTYLSFQIFGDTVWTDGEYIYSSSGNSQYVLNKPSIDSKYSPTYQTRTLGSWTAGTATSHVTPTGTDTVLQALQKIDNNQRNDETNILFIQQTIGDINLVLEEVL